jgi:hypothetical protein
MDDPKRKEPALPVTPSSSMIAGLGPIPGAEVPPASDIGPQGEDLAIQRELQELEDTRKEEEKAAGKPVKVIEYTPGEVTGMSWRTVGTIVVLIIIVIAAIYLVAVPRADAELVIRYNEGIMGSINVDARVENHGTRDMTDIRISILVQNSTDVRMADLMEYTGSVVAHGDASLDSITFQGDQWETYHIFVEWTFECAGETYHGSEHYNTEGDAMNVWFNEDITV